MYIKGHPEISERIFKGQYTQLLEEISKKTDTALNNMLLAYCYSNLGYDKKALTKIEVETDLTYPDLITFVISRLLIVEILINAGKKFDFVTKKLVILSKLSSIQDDPYKIYLKDYLSLLEAKYLIS